MEDTADDAERRRRRDLLLGTSFTNKDNAKAVKYGRYSVVDLFCGCGGLSAGLESTGLFQTLIAVDKSPVALATFAANHHNAKKPPLVIEADLGRLDASVIRKKLRRQGILTGQLDCLVGGPPCEGYSQNKAERSNARSQFHFLALKSHSTRHWDGAEQMAIPRLPNKPARAHRKDDRNTLFRVILRVAELCRPKIVLIENVPDILTYRNGAVRREIELTLKRLGYFVDIRILNAADYGVPQLRRRAFIVAQRKDVHAASMMSAFPGPTHTASESSGRLKDLRGDHGRHVTVWEAIGDLPLPRVEKGVRSRPAGHRASAKLSKYRAWAQCDGPVCNHEERPISQRVLKRVRAMKPGMRTHELPSRLRTRKFYYNSYGRLQWDRPANTVTKSCMYLGSGKFAHPEQDRGLTVREAARLQSFTDGFKFVGSSPKMIANLIGGAVPPLLARAFGLQIASLLAACERRERVRVPRKIGATGYRAAERRRRTIRPISAQTPSVSSRTRHSA